MTTIFNELELDDLIKRRILSRIKKIPSGNGTKGECWIYQGQKDKDGYGRIGINKRKENYNKKFYTHRLMYAHFKGSIKDKMEIHHECENRACCNPAHLSTKSRKENMAIRWDGKRPEGIQVELF